MHTIAQLLLLYTVAFYLDAKRCHISFYQHSHMVYGITRFHLIVLTTWQFSIFFGTQLIFPIFSNYIPKWRCGSKGPMGFDCVEYNRCNGTVEFEEVAFQSAAIEFNWFCDRRYYATLASQFQYIGVLLGTITFGPASDALGRKPVSAAALILGILATFGSGLAHTPIVYYIARFFVGLSLGGVSVTLYTFINELLLPQQRMVLRGVFNWGIGRLLLTLICMAFGEWRTSAIALSLGAVPALLIVLFLLPESPTWLHSKNRTLQMIESEKIIARRAGIPYVPESHRKIVKSKTLREVLKSREMFRRLSVLWLMWFTASTCAYANDLNSSTISGNFYLNQILFSLVIYASKLILLTVDTRFAGFTRRLLHQGAQTGVILCFGVLSVFTLLNVQGAPFIVFNLLGTVFIEYTWDACYLCATESMESAARASGTGSCSFMARAGSILAPALAYMNLLYPGAVYMTVVGVGAICLAFSYAMLVETKGVNLDNVVLTKEETENAEAEALADIEE